MEERSRLLELTDIARRTQQDTSRDLRPVSKRAQVFSLAALNSCLDDRLQATSNAMHPHEFETSLSWLQCPRTVQIELGITLSPTSDEVLRMSAQVTQQQL